MIKVNEYCWKAINNQNLILLDTYSFVMIKMNSFSKDIYEYIENNDVNIDDVCLKFVNNKLTNEEIIIFIEFLTKKGFVYNEAEVKANS